MDNQVADCVTIKKQVTTVWKYKVVDDKPTYYVAKVIADINNQEYITLLFIPEENNDIGYLFNPHISSLQIIDSQFKCISDDCIQDNRIISLFQQITCNQSFHFQKAHSSFTWILIKFNK